MDPISIAMGLAKFAPMIAGWFGGDDAEETANKVVTVAKQVTGMDDESKAMSAIHNDPALQIQFQQAMNPIIIAKLDAETKQQAEINTTMRAELTSKSLFKSGWRPLLGWTIAINFGALMSAIVAVILYGAFKEPKVIAEFITALSALMGTLTVIWSMALAVLGVNVSKRSQDKALAAGHPPQPNVLSSLASRWLGK